MDTTCGRVRRAGVLAALVLTGCGAAAQRFPLRDPLWVDDDARPYAPMPAQQYNPWVSDAAESTVLRPLAEVWRWEEPRESINVNAVDEVPSSSWFENRIGQRAMPHEELAAGACAGSHVPPAPWTIVERKAQGETPGFVIEVEGQRYLFKTDIRVPELTTAADAIATRIFHAVGYSTPCNHVVDFTPDVFRIAPGTTRDDSGELMTQADVDEVLDVALPTPDGRLRGSLSRFLDGEALGGWRFEGRRGDDPNDVVAHEHRREVRGMYVLSAWLNHIDSRSANHHDAWVTRDGVHGYVRHHILDVGDTFGLTWADSDEMTRRFGHSYYVDLEHIGVDLLTLGLLDRPYRPASSDRPHPVFTYYEVEHFEPDAWRSGYPNAAFDRRTEHDTAWMARILSQISEGHLRALVSTGRFSRDDVASDLERILRGRQLRILERYLTRLSPLAFAEVETRGGHGKLCLRDLAVESGLRRAADRRYDAHASIDWPEAREPVELAAQLVHPSGDEARVCMPLPDLRGASERAPRYLVVDVVASSRGQETTGAASVHLYQTGPQRYRVVGLRRREP
jgi:hypothetical protein